MTPWESVEKNKASAHQIGPFHIGKLEYDTLQGDRFSGLWLEFEIGEGMQVKHGVIPEGVSPEWLMEFWKREF